MNKKYITVLTIGLMSLISLFAQTENIIMIDEDIQLIHLQDSIFIHVSMHQSGQYGRFSSNGLIIIKNGKAVMVDTPMDNEKTERLTKYIMDSLNVKLTTLIIGHFHADCMGGLEYLKRIGVNSIANSKTIEKCKEIDLPVPSIAFTETKNFDFNGEIIECGFFGAGHSFDNITVWIPNKKILFGGCLIKSLSSRSLGNLADAVVSDWDLTVQNIMKEYPDIKTVIPGHGSYGGSELLTHTIELVEKEKSKL